MVDTTNYWIAWIAYLLAAGLFCLIFWRATRFQHRRVLKYCLRAMLLAIIATPWYVSDTGSVMAPALIIVLMDAITIGAEAAVRAFVPLFLSVTLSLVFVGVILLVKRGKSHRLDEIS
jgi:hypothetical protein